MRVVYANDIFYYCKKLIDRFNVFYLSAGSDSHRDIYHNRA